MQVRPQVGLGLHGRGGRGRWGGEEVAAVLGCGSGGAGGGGGGGGAADERLCVLLALQPLAQLAVLALLLARLHLLVQRHIHHIYLGTATLSSNRWSHPPHYPLHPPLRILQASPQQLQCDVEQARVDLLDAQALLGVWEGGGGVGWGGGEADGAEVGEGGGEAADAGVEGAGGEVEGAVLGLGGVEGEVAGDEVEGGEGGEEVGRRGGFGVEGVDAAGQRGQLTAEGRHHGWREREGQQSPRCCGQWVQWDMGNRRSEPEILATGVRRQQRRRRGDNRAGVRGRGWDGRWEGLGVGVEEMRLRRVEAGVAEVRVGSEATEAEEQRVKVAAATTPQQSRGGGVVRCTRSEHTTTSTCRVHDQQGMSPAR